MDGEDLFKCEVVVVLKMFKYGFYNGSSNCGSFNNGGVLLLRCKMLFGSS